MGWGEGRGRRLIYSSYELEDVNRSIHFTLTHAWRGPRHRAGRDHINSKMAFLVSKSIGLDVC